MATSTFNKELTMRILFVLLLSVVLLVPTLALAANTGTLGGAAGGGSNDCPLENIVTAVVTSTAGANTSAIAAQGAGIRVYLDQVIISNTGTTKGRMLVTDGSGGTTIINLPFSEAGGTFPFRLPWPFTANTAIFVDPTGTDDIIVSLHGCKRTL
jgi:hypothetical protein